MIGLGLSLVGGDIAQASSQFNRNVQPYSNSHSLSFDGTNSAAVLTGANIETLTNSSFTWAFWIYDTGYSTATFGGFKDSNGTANDFYLRYLPVAPGVNFLQPYYKLNGIGSNAVFNIGSSLTTNAWHHIAMTVQVGSSATDTSTIKIYLDGVLKGTATNGPKKSDHEATTIESDMSWAIGGRTDKDSSASPTAADRTSSVIDEVAFWTTALPADDIGTLYNSGNGTFDLSSDFGSYNSSSSLQHWFRLNNDLSDSTGNAANGKSQGSPTFITSNTPDS